MLKKIAIRMKEPPNFSRNPIFLLPALTYIRGECFAYPTHILVCAVWIKVIG